MAKDEAINHDGASTVATVGSKVAKWGLLGGLLGAAAIPLLGAAIIGGTFAAIAALASATTATILIIGGIGAGIGTIGGAAAAGVLAPTIIGTSAVTGAALGVFKGADQVSRETSAFRAKVTARMNNSENKEAKIFNDGEIKGIDEGYALAVNDLKPQIDAAREQGRQEGAQMVVAQIQEHMQQEMAAQQAAAEAQTHGNKHVRVDAGHDKANAPHGAKPAVTLPGGKVIASCECGVDADGKPIANSKAAGVIEQRLANEAATHTV